MYNLLLPEPLERTFWWGQTNTNNYDHIWPGCPSPFVSGYDPVQLLQVTAPQHIQAPYCHRRRFSSFTFSFSSDLISNLPLHSFSFLFLSFFKDQNRTQRSHWRHNKATGVSTRHCFHQSQARRLNPLPSSPSRRRSGILERNPLLPTGSPNDRL